jgi:ribosomal protein S17E
MRIRKCARAVITNEYHEILLQKFEENMRLHSRDFSHE